MMKYVKWGLSLAVGGFLILFGITKFTGGAHIFPLIEMKATALGLPGAGLFYPVVNYLVGIMELAAGALVILPMTRQKFGALFAIVPFLGAFVFHISPLLGVITPNGYALGAPGLSEALASGSGFQPTHFTSAAAGETGPVLFILATVFLGLSIANFVIHRREA